MNGSSPGGPWCCECPVRSSRRNTISCSIPSIRISPRLASDGRNASNSTGGYWLRSPLLFKPPVRVFLSAIRHSGRLRGETYSQGLSESVPTSPWAEESPYSKAQRPKPRIAIRCDIHPHSRILRRRLGRCHLHDSRYGFAVDGSPSNHLPYPRRTGSESRR